MVERCKENRKLVTVIIPVYNVEPYLRRALDSVLTQTYTNLEILCAESESPDSCGKILDEYAQNDSRIHVFHKSNEGVSASRNYCLDRATGDYITFLDPDDWVEKNAYETMLDAIEQQNADMVICNYSKDWDDKRKVMINSSQTESIIEGYDAILQHIFHRTIYPGIAGYIWNKMYRRELIGTHRFNEGITIAEDVWFNVHVTEDARKAVILQDSFYHYYQRSNSLFHSIDLEKREKILDIYEDMIQTLMSKGIPSTTIKYLQRFYVYHAGGLVKIAYKLNDSERLNRYQDAIRKYLPIYEATSEGHEEWNKRMRELLSDPGNVVAREG